MRAWFAQLRPNDRRALIIGLAVLVVVLGYLFIWEPAAKHLVQLRQTVNEQQSLLTWMQQAAQQVQQLRGSTGGAAKIADGQSLLAVVDQSAKSGHLGTAMKRVEPEGQNTVRVWFEQANFDDLVLWLEGLQRTYNVGVANIVIERQTTPGLVNVRLSLEGDSA